MPEALSSRSRPAEGFAEVAVWDLSTSTDLARIRQELGAEVSGGADGAPDVEEVQDQMVLVVSELATNALRHGAPPSRVRLLRDGTAYVLDVTDNAPDASPELVDGRPLGEGGFGIHLTAQLATDVGWYVEDGTKHVWACFDLPGSTG